MVVDTSFSDVSIEITHELAQFHPAGHNLADDSLDKTIVANDWVNVAYEPWMLNNLAVP